MKNKVYLNESQLKDIIERVIQESKKDDKFNRNTEVKEKKIGAKKSSQKEMKEDLDPMELELGKSYKYMHPDPTQRDEMEYQGSEQDFNSLNLDSKIYKFKFKKGKGNMIFTDVTPIQTYEN